MSQRHPLKSEYRPLSYYYSKTGALKSNRNKAYNGRTVGVWAAQGKGDISAKNGALVLTAGQDQFGVITRVTPSLVSTAWLEFEARSINGSLLSAQWTSKSRPKASVAEHARDFRLSGEWEKHRIKIDFPGRINQVRFVLSHEDDAAELRHVKLLTPDQTVITEYEFY